MILRRLLSIENEQNNAAEKQGQEQHSERTAKRKMMSISVAISVASIGLCPPHNPDPQPEGVWTNSGEIP